MHVHYNKFDYGIVCDDMRLHNKNGQERRKSMETKNVTANSLTIDHEYNMLMSALKVSVSKHLMDEEFTVVWANDYYFETIGYTREEYEQKFHGSVRQYYANDEEIYNEIAGAVMDAIHKQEPVYECICKMPRKDGTYIWIKIVGHFTDEMQDGKAIIYSVFTDITDLIVTKMEKSITYDKLPGFTAKYRIHQDKSFDVLDYNQRFVDFFGEAVLHQHTYDAFESSTVDFKIEDVFEKLMRKETIQMEATTHDANGNLCWLQINGEAIDEVQGDPIYLFIYIDITSQKQDEEKLRQLVYVDPITNGYNRNRFELEVHKQIQKEPNLLYAYVSLDIDKFKLINDMFGISEGDRTLAFVYRQLLAHLHKGECVSRFTGNTYILFLIDDGKRMIHERLQKMLADINGFNEIASTKYMLSFHAGIYYVDDTKMALSQMLDRSDIARKNISHNVNGNQFSYAVYSREDRKQLLKEKDIENRMYEALANGEFVIYLQPKVSLMKQSVTGAEALVRWQDPEYGLIPPNDFIPLFEKNGFIIKLDHYVFEEVCKVMKKWQKEGTPLMIVSFNMSRAHISNPDFLQPYNEIRARYDIPAKYLEFEITETMIYENPTNLKQIIGQLHEAGYLCSLDDFGSGYSSLNLLKDLPFDVIKLDKAFFDVTQENNKRQKDIIVSLIEMSKKLEMISVAEGVESKTQAAFLKENNCDLIQGYVYSRPVPVEEFARVKEQISNR